MLSCAEPLALPSRSPVCSSLSGPPRLSSALQPEAQSATEPPPLRRSTTVKTPQLNSPERGCGRPLHPRPNAPPHCVPCCFPGSRAAGKSDGIPLDAINISFAFPWLSLPPSVSLNLLLLQPPSKCYPVTCRGEIQPSPAQIEQAGEEGQALRRRQRGKEGRRKAERKRRRRRSKGGCALAVESNVADRLMEALSLSLPPTLAKH